MSQDNQGANAMREGEEKVSRFAKWRRAILTSFTLIGLSLAAIVANQPSVDPPPLPIVALGVNEWVSTGTYHTVIAGYPVDVPAGARSDLASIPHAAAKALGIPRDHPAIRRGAFCHDRLYRTKEVTRAKADWLLWRACLEDGMNPDKAGAVYQWVRTWGFEAWDNQG